MTTYYKAVRPDGTSFHDRSFRWLPADGLIPAGGVLVKHPAPAARIGKGSDATASGYLSVSTEAADCTGFQWPCRLLLVEPIGRALLDDEYPHKRRVKAARVVGEVEPWHVFGPNGQQVVAFLDLLPGLSDAAGAAAWSAADSAASLIVRDLITDEQFATLTAPMRAAGIDFDQIGSIR